MMAKMSSTTKDQTIHTYQRALLPEPATCPGPTIISFSNSKRMGGHTFTMDPQE